MPYVSDSLDIELRTHVEEGLNTCLQEKKEEHTWLKDPSSMQHSWVPPGWRIPLSHNLSY